MSELTAKIADDEADNGGLLARLARLALGRTANLRRALLLVWRSSRAWTSATAALIALDSVLPIALLYTIKLFIDATTEVLGGGATDQAFVSITPYLLLACAIAIAQAAVAGAMRLAQDAHAQLITDHMFGLLHRQASAIDLRHFEDTGFRDMIHRAQREAPFRPARVLASVLDLCRGALSLCAMAALIVSFHWAALPILVLVALPGGLVRLAFARRLYQLSLAQTQRIRRLGYFDSLVFGISFALEARMLSLGRWVTTRAHELRGILRRERMHIIKVRTLTDVAGEAFAVAGMFAVIALLGFQALAGAITVGSLVMYFQALQRAWNNFGQTLRALATLREHSLFIDDVYRFLDLRAEVVAPAEPTPMPRPMDVGISLRGVAFRYPNAETDALIDVSFDIAKGEHVAIVGRNGSGKTTLVKLLCRLYDPTQGTIAIDGIDLRRLDPDDLRASFSVLVQGFARYQETARENIRLGAHARDPSDEAIHEAAMQSGADGFVTKLPLGYDTMLGRTFDGGHELSGGQWQKLALARAFVRDAEIIVLDEPTSSLDAVAEHELIERFRELARNRTTILISHRLSTVMGMDRIIVMDSGIVADQGTHAELMARSDGPYAQLFRFQRKIGR